MVRSKAHLSHFDKNWTDFEGGVAKILFFICFKMADRHHVGKLQMDIVRIGITQGTKQHKNDAFWTTFSKVMHFCLSLEH